MKKILATSIMTLAILTLANAQSENVERKSEPKNRPEMRQEMSNSFRQFMGDSKDVNLYIGTTGDSNIDAQIKTLRDGYVVKMKALQEQYKIDLKNIVGSKILTVGNKTDKKDGVKVLPPQASATATAAVNKEHEQNENAFNASQPPKGFFNKLKTWLGMDR